MEAKLDSLIAKIKQDGVDEAKRQAEAIISKAEEESAFLIENAKKEASRIIAESNKQAEKTRASTETALRQAARDLILTVREKVKGLFAQALQEKVSETVSVEFLRDIVLRVAREWHSDRPIHVLSSAQDTEKLQALVYEQLKNDARKIITISADPRINRGIRIGLNDEHLYCDITDESISEMLQEFLNPQIASLLKDREINPNVK